LLLSVGDELPIAGVGLLLTERAYTDLVLEAGRCGSANLATVTDELQRFYRPALE
jgi:hypothetical protein